MQDWCVCMCVLNTLQHWAQPRGKRVRVQSHPTKPSGQIWNKDLLAHLWHMEREGGEIRERKVLMEKR